MGIIKQWLGPASLELHLFWQLGDAAVSSFLFSLTVQLYYKRSCKGVNKTAIDSLFLFDAGWYITKSKV